jgi:ribose 5-phosphate isomerase B
MTPGPSKSSRRIALGSDHAGFSLKEALKKHLEVREIVVTDVGTDSADSVDYPDQAADVAFMVSKGEVPEGILVCGTGIGMCIAANKFAGVRAADAVTTEMAKLARSHNDANILCLGARLIDEKTALEILDVWLAEPFDGGRHERRVKKIRALDPKPRERKKSRCC